jgi:G3E family GTPase
MLDFNIVGFVFVFLIFFLIIQYGEIDIDGSLVAAKSAGAEDIVMLNNGCLCCTVRGDLVRMIGELVDRKKGKFDHIVIETTGKLSICSSFCKLVDKKKWKFDHLVIETTGNKAFVPLVINIHL